MKTTILTSVKYAKTLEAFSLLNYYNGRYLKNEELTASGIAEYSKTKSILELLGLYSEFSLQGAIAYYKTLTDNDIDEFRNVYGYSFNLNFYYIRSLVNKLDSKEINVIDLIISEN